MKNVKRVIKGLLVGMVVITGCLVNGISVNADTIQSNQDKMIIGVYTESNDNFYVEKGSTITEFEDGSYYINSDVNIQSIDKLNNTITIFDKANELYTFNVGSNEIDSYYLDEQINITVNQDSQLIDCIVDSQPIVYKNISIANRINDTVYVNVNDKVYSFYDMNDSDGWNVGEKCNVIVQDGKLLEVRPVPLAEI